MAIPQFIFCNGEFVEESTACIPVTDRGFLFGDAVFTTIKVEGGEPQFFEQHAERLKKQCDILQIIPPEFLLTDVAKLILKNKATEGIWRLKIIITGGNRADLSLSPREFGKHLMMIFPVISDPIHECKLTVYPHLVYRPSAKLKTLSYLDRLMISEYAVTSGFDCAILVSKEGFVTETAFSNIFWRLGQKIFIPDQTLEWMQGITITYWIGVLKTQGFKTHEVKEKIEDIPAKAQVFMCNAIKGVVPVIAIDERQFQRDEKIEKEIFNNAKYRK